MIEAINFCNSNHGSRNFLQPNVSYEKSLNPSRTAFCNDTKKLVAVGACTGAFSMITDTLLNTNELVKNNFSVIKSIMKDAVIWGAIGGACYGAFRLIEMALIRKPQQS